MSNLHRELEIVIELANDNVLAHKDTEGEPVLFDARNEQLAAVQSIGELNLVIDRFEIDSPVNLLDILEHVESLVKAYEGVGQVEINALDALMACWGD